MTAYYLENWERRKKIFLWDRGKISSVSTSEAPDVADGFIKKFVTGGVLVVLRKPENWFILCEGDELPVKDIEDVEVRKHGVFYVMDLNIGGRVFRYRDFCFFDLFARKFDPTYDWIDEELVFGFWLKNLIGK